MLDYRLRWHHHHVAAAPPGVCRNEKTCINTWLDTHGEWPRRGNDLGTICGVTSVDGWRDGWPVYLGTMGSIRIGKRVFTCFCVGCFGYFEYAMGKEDGIALYAPHQVSFLSFSTECSAHGIGG